MADSSINSIGNAIRCMLSPNLFGNNDPADLHASAIKDTKVLPRSNLVDDKCAFLPISNFLQTLSPMPDATMDVYNSQEGKRGEQISFMDGYSEYNGVFDVTATFDNMDGDFITAFFGAWLEYGNRVVEGTVMPFPVFLQCNEIDYVSRYYRIILDKSRRFVQNIAAPGYCYPKSNPDGAKFAYDRNVSYSSENNTVQIVFQCVGAQKNRNILLHEFNQTVNMFNESMISKRDMTKIDQSKSPIPFELMSIFNYELYPCINTNTYELEWWCYTAVYDSKIKEIQRILTDLTGEQPQATVTPDNTPVVSRAGLSSMLANSSAGALSNAAKHTTGNTPIDLTTTNTPPTN
jgi:hypothetical protein